MVVVVVYYTAGSKYVHIIRANNISSKKYSINSNTLINKSTRRAHTYAKANQVWIQSPYPQSGSEL